MDFNVTVNIPALDRLVDVLKAGVSMPAVAAASAEGKPAASETKTVSRGSSQPKQDPKADVAGAAEKPKTDDTAAASTNSTATSPSEPATVEADLNAVKAKAMALSQKKGRDVLVTTLAEYGATNISGLPADQFAAFIANADAKLAA